MTRLKVTLKNNHYGLVWGTVPLLWDHTWPPLWGPNKRALRKRLQWPNNAIDATIWYVWVLLCPKNTCIPIINKNCPNNFTLWLYWLKDAENCGNGLLSIQYKNTPQQLNKLWSTPCPMLMHKVHMAYGTVCTCVQSHCLHQQTSSGLTETDVSENAPVANWRYAWFDRLRAWVLPLFIV